MNEGCRERNETIERGNALMRFSKTLFFLMLIFELFYQLLYWGEWWPPKTYVCTLVPDTVECDLMWKRVIVNVIK